MRREAEQNIVPDPEVDAFMKVWRLRTLHAPGFCPAHPPCCLVCLLVSGFDADTCRAVGPQSEAQMGTRYSVVTELMLRLLGLDYVANTMVHPSPPAFPAYPLAGQTLQKPSFC